MRIFKYRIFQDWAESERLKNEVLLNAIKELENGLYEANLGSGLYKKRIAIAGKGKSGGYRTLIVFKKGEKAFFVYGFSKSTKANISDTEEKAYRKLSKTLLEMSSEEINRLLEIGKLFEVK